MLEQKKGSKYLSPIVLYIEGMGAVLRETNESKEMKVLEEDIEQLIPAIYNNHPGFIEGYDEEKRKQLKLIALSLCVLLYKKSDKLRELLGEQVQLSGYEYVEELLSKTYQSKKAEKVSQLLEDIKVPNSFKITFYADKIIGGYQSIYYDKLLAIYEEDPENVLTVYQTLKKEKKPGTYLLFAFLRKKGRVFEEEEISELENQLREDIGNRGHKYQSPCVLLYEVSQFARKQIKKILEAETSFSVLGEIQIVAKLFYKEIMENVLEEMAKEIEVKLILQQAIEREGDISAHEVRKLAKQHLEEADELIREKIKAGDSNITEYVALLYTEDIGMKSETLVSVFNHRLKTVIKFMEAFVVDREEQVREEMKKLQSIKNATMQEAFARLEAKWDSKKHTKAIEASNTTEEVVSYIDGIYKPVNDKVIPYLEEIEGLVSSQDREEKQLPLVLLKYYLSEYMLTKEITLLKTCEAVKRFMDEGRLKLFINKLYERWLGEGADTKEKNILILYALNGGNAELMALKKQIDEWTENARGALAAFAVTAMAINGSSMALMLTEGIATKYKNKQVKAAAIEAMDYVAKLRGLSKEELADKIVPSLGFDENRELLLSYGTRAFKVKLTPEMNITLFDEEKKKEIKSLPKPGAKDDEEKALAAIKDFTGLKKQLKTILTTQQQRLAKAILTGRSWQQESWQELFVKNPIMNSFAISLIWGEYDEEGSLLETFRYMEDGSFNTVEEEAYSLSEGTVIRLVHPMDLKEEEKVAWMQQLEDYELTQSVMQLDTPIYTLEAEDENERTFKRFKGEEIYFGKVLGAMDKYEWQKTAALDGGCYEGIYYEDEASHIGMLLRLDTPYMGMQPTETVKIQELLFYKKGTVNIKGYYEEETMENNLIPLKEVPAKILNIGLMMLHLIRG